MVEFTSLVLNHKYALIILAIIAILVVLLAIVVVVFLVAFIQDRAISLWPPSIGEKPKAINTGRDEPESVDTCFYVDRAAYYEKYYTMVSGANKSVIMVGDGFACHDIENNKYANGLIGAIKCALDKGVTVKRFQFHTTLSLVWLRSLCDLKEEYGDLFQIYMHVEYDPVALPYVICLVDHDQKNSSVNVMFTRASDTTLEEKLGGPAFIFDRGKNIERLLKLMKLSVEDFFNSTFNISCSDLLDMHDELKASRETKIQEYYSREVSIDVDQTSIMKVARTLETLDVCFVKEVAMQEISNRNEMYFAYGSNIDKERIRKRCPSARVIALGELSDYKLMFNMIGNKAEGKGGGIANIKKSNGDSVYGVLYRIEAAELERLSDLEKSMSYNVENLGISVSDSEDVNAAVYICHDESNDSYAPTKNYRDFIIDGMKMHKFPESYQEKVRRLVGG